MKKFSKLNESVELDVDKLESLLNQIEDISWKIYYNYFLNKEKLYYKSLTYCKKGDNLVRLLIIDPNIKSNYVSIEGWNSHPLNFQSSSFIEKRNISDLSEKYNKIFNILKEFKENNPSIIFKENKILIFFIDKEISDYEINLSEEMKEATKFLFQLLKDVNYLELRYYHQFNQLKLKFKGDFNENRDFGFIKTIQIQNQNKKGFEWMKDYDEIEDITDIRDEINSLGFYINLNPDKYETGSYTIELEKFGG